MCLFSLVLLLKTTKVLQKRAGRAKTYHIPFGGKVNSSSFIIIFFYPFLNTRIGCSFPLGCVCAEVEPSLQYNTSQMACFGDVPPAINSVFNCSAFIFIFFVQLS